MAAISPAMIRINLSQISLRHLPPEAASIQGEKACDIRPITRASTQSKPAPRT
jgi:hypothetical protein